MGVRSVIGVMGNVNLLLVGWWDGGMVGWYDGIMV